MSLLPDEPSDLLYVKRKGVLTIYSGYKREYLARNLSEMEAEFLICKVCSGITRDASIYNEETTCFVCSESLYENSVKMVRKAVNQLDIKCPIQRDCTWKGKLSEAELHLEICEYFIVRCKCNSSFFRKDLQHHEDRSCPFRLVECHYCYVHVKADNHNKHLRQCAEYPTSCSNKCGAKFARKELTRHKSKCELEEIACPYKEYGCKAKSMIRKDLLAHKKEFYIEHQDMSFVVMKSEIEELKNEILCLTNKQTQFELERSTMKDKIEWEIAVGEITDNFLIEGPKFYVYKYHLMLCLNPNYTRLGFKIQLRFCLKRIGGQHDKDLGKAYISKYKVILVNRFEEEQSYFTEGQMSYELEIGQSSEYFGVRDLNTLGLNLFKVQSESSMFVRFYFEIDFQKPLVKLKPLTPF